MQLKLHANATTTPRVRAYIQASTASVAALARELGVSETTIRRWKGRTSVTDGSHVAKRLAISLTPLEERLVVELRTALQLPLDDIVEVMRRCMNPKLSRSAIHRCLKRHGVSTRHKPARPEAGRFEPAEVHDREIAPVVHVQAEIEIVREHAECEHGEVLGHGEAGTEARREKKPEKAQPEVHGSAKPACPLASRRAVAGVWQPLQAIIRRY